MLPQSIMTEDEEISLCEIVNIVYTTTGATLTDQLGLLRSSAAITPAVSVLPEVEAYIEGTKDVTKYPGPPAGTIHGITYPGMTPTALNRLKKYIRRWDEIGTDTDRIVQGNVGDITQETSDPREEQTLIRERVRNMFPFFTKSAWDARQAAGDGYTEGRGASGGGAVATIPMIR